MSLSGLTGSLSRGCILHLHARGQVSLNKRVAVLPNSGKPRELYFLERSSCRRNNWAGSTQRCNILRTPLLKCAMDASYGDATHDSPVVFPRINVKDPYKRLGISSEASEEEIQGARNFLVQKYASHQPSVDAIESAHDKIIMQQFYDRKKPKINIKKKIREVTQSPVIQTVKSRFRTPAMSFIIKTSVAFVLLGALTVLYPTEEGPTLQVAISLIATIYFINERLKSKLWAFLYGAGTFAVAWILGTFLKVSVIPPVVKGFRSLEVTTSLITYVFLWISSTYLR